MIEEFKKDNKKDDKKDDKKDVEKKDGKDDKKLKVEWCLVLNVFVIVDDDLCR